MMTSIALPAPRPRRSPPNLISFGSPADYRCGVVETMRLLLDTSAYSALMRGHERIRRAVRANEEIFLNSIVIGELTAGFIKGSRRKKMRRNCADFSRLRALDSWMSPKKRLNDTQLSSMGCGRPAPRYPHMTFG
jgi:hypothetical protein